MLSNALWNLHASNTALAYIVDGFEALRHNTYNVLYCVSLMEVNAYLTSITVQNDSGVSQCHHCMVPAEWINHYCTCAAMDSLCP